MAIFIIEALEQATAMHHRGTTLLTYTYIMQRCIHFQNTSSLSQSKVLHSAIGCDTQRRINYDYKSRVFGSRKLNHIPELKKLLTAS